MIETIRQIYGLCECEEPGCCSKCGGRIAKAQQVGERPMRWVENIRLWFIVGGLLLIVGAFYMIWTPLGVLATALLLIGWGVALGEVLKELKLKKK